MEAVSGSVGFIVCEARVTLGCRMVSFVRFGWVGLAMTGLLVGFGRCRI